MPSASSLRSFRYPQRLSSPSTRKTGLPSHEHQNKPPTCQGTGGLQIHVPLCTYTQQWAANPLGGTKGSVTPLQAQRKQRVCLDWSFPFSVKRTRWAGTSSSSYLEMEPNGGDRVTMLLEKVIGKEMDYMGVSLSAYCIEMKQRLSCFTLRSVDQQVSCTRCLLLPFFHCSYLWLG